MCIISTGLLMIMYVINYGKVLDWMASTRICVYLVVAPVLIAFFIWMQYHSEKPYVNLAPLYQPKAIVGYFYMMMVMFFSTSTVLLTNYLSTILKVDTRTLIRCTCGCCRGISWEQSFVSGGSGGSVGVSVF